MKKIKERFQKNELFKIIALSFLIVVVLTWIIPAGSYSSGTFTKSTTEPQGIFDLARTPLIALANLVQYAFYFIVLGGFYGVLNKTGVYSKIVNGISEKTNKKTFLVVSTVLFIILSSTLGLTWGLVLIVPFITAVLMKMGYSKMTAFMATFGAILVGGIGNTFSYNIAYYFINVFGTKLINDTMLGQVIILAIVLVLYISLLLKVSMPKVESKTDKKTKKDKKDTKEEVKGEVIIPLYEEYNNSKKSTLPFIIITVLSFLVAIIAMFSWQDVLKVDLFSDLYTKMTEITIGDYPIFYNILGKITQFGNWGIYDLIIFIVLVMFLIAWLYNVKLDDIIDGFKKGAKDVLAPAFYSVLASVVFAVMFGTSTGNNIGFTIMDFILGLTDKFNVFTMSITSIISSFLYNDFGTLVGSGMAPVASIYSGSDSMSLITLIISSIYGLVMLVAPTSVVLISGLSYFNVSYKDWMKTIWKTVLAILAILLIVFVILAL